MMRDEIDVPFRRFLVHQEGICEIPLYGVIFPDGMCVIRDTVDGETQNIQLKDGVLVGYMEVEWLDDDNA